MAVVMVTATAFGMQRFSVSIWGKRYTFLLMFAVPLMLLAADDGRGANLVMIWRGSLLSQESFSLIRLHLRTFQRFVAIFMLADSRGKANFKS